MAVQDYLIAIDIGTTSAKSFAIAANGEVLSSHQRFYSTSFLDCGEAEQDAAVIYDAVCTLIKDSLVLQKRCLCISFSAAMHSITAVDKNGDALLPLLIWSDTRSKEQSRRLIDSGLAQKFYEVSGTPVHPMSPLCKLIWLKENRPEIFDKAHKFISIKEFVLYRMTGKFVIDHSTASATGLFDIDRLTWSEAVLNYVGLKVEKLSVPVPVKQLLPIAGVLAEECQLPPDTPIVIGASDGCLAQWGSDAMGSDDITITVGTSGAVRIASSARALDRQGKIFNYILKENTFVCGGATNCGSALLNWFKDSMDKDASDDIAEFAKEASKIQAGSEGLVCIPFLLGERAPVYDPEASGIFWGVKVHHNKLHFQHALLEGICFEIKWILETIENVFGRKNNITLSGGITRSPVWVQLLCDVLGRTVRTQAGIDASAAGAAKLGFEALHIKYQVAETMKSTFTPNEDFRKLYENHFSVFKKIYENLEGVKL